MARPRQFDEQTVLEAALDCFWARGYEATSIRALIDKTGLTGASLYNAFGDKRALFEKSLHHYVERSIADRIRRCQVMPPSQAIATFFGEVIQRSVKDVDHKGCLLVNSAVDVAPHDAEFARVVTQVLKNIESFFRQSIEQGQLDGIMTTAMPADDLARHLLATLLGIRVLARARPERDLLEGIVRSALKMLARPPGG